MENKNSNLTLIMIAAIPFVVVSSNLVLIPIYPMMKSLLNLSTMQMNMFLSAFSVAEASVLLIVGFLSDRFGRIRVLVPSLALFGLGGILSGIAVYTASAESYSLILASRILQGMAGAGTTPVAIALIGDIFVDSEEGRALGILESSNALAKVLSPVIGAMLAYLSWHSAFFVTPFLCLIVACLLFLNFRGEDKPTEMVSALHYLKNIKFTMVKQSKVLLPLFFMGTLSICILYGIPYYLTFVLENQYKITGITKACLLALPLLGLVTASYWTGTKLKEDPGYVQKGMVMGLLIIVGSQLFLSFFDGLYLSIFLFSVSCLGIGFVLPTVGAHLLKITQPAERGMIFAVYGCFRCLGVACGIPLFSHFIKGSHEVLFLSIAGVSLTLVTYVIAAGVARREVPVFSAEVLEEDIAEE